MLPKSKRLTTKDFNGLRAKMVFRGTYVDVAVSPSLATRFACVISKKRVKKAVDRNTIRRKIYHILSSVVVASPHFIIVYPKQNVLSGSFTEIQKEILEVFATL